MTNSGLFTRQTIGAILNGWDDPLISVANTLTLSPGVALPSKHTGTLGPYRSATNTVEDLEAAIAAGDADAADYVKPFGTQTWDPAELQSALIFCPSAALSGVRGLFWQGRCREQRQICLFPGFRSTSQDKALWPPTEQPKGLIGRGWP